MADRIWARDLDSISARVRDILLFFYYLLKSSFCWSLSSIPFSPLLLHTDFSSFPRNSDSWVWSFLSGGLCIRIMHQVSGRVTLTVSLTSLSRIVVKGQGTLGSLSGLMGRDGRRGQKSVVILSSSFSSWVLLGPGWGEVPECTLVPYKVSSTLLALQRSVSVHPTRNIFPLLFTKLSGRIIRLH